MEPVVLLAHVRARARLQARNAGQLVPARSDRAGQRAGRRRPCWRCGHLVERRNLSQWNFKITDYADGCWPGSTGSTAGPNASRRCSATGSAAAKASTFAFDVEGVDASIDVFTTRVDTVYGVTFMAIAPEHPIVADTRGDYRRAKRAVEAFAASLASKSELERTQSDGKDRRADRRVRDQSALGRAGADLGHELRAGRIRHRRRDGRARARRTRLRFCAQVRPAIVDVIVAMAGDVAGASDSLRRRRRAGRQR